MWNGQDDGAPQLPPLGLVLPRTSMLIMSVERELTAWAPRTRIKGGTDVGSDAHLVIPWTHKHIRSLASGLCQRNL